MKTEKPEQVQEVLAGLRTRGVRDVDDSSLARALYSTDASLYRVVPKVVVRPRSEEEVLATLEVCRTTGTALTSRGAGTSIAGNAVGPGVVMDFSKYLNKVISFDAEARTAEVQPGAVHAVLQRALAGSGLRYGPDPSTHTRCTIGGMIGNNACGNRALGYGRAADNVAALDVATIAGEQLALRQGVRMESPTLDRLHEVVQGGLATIRTEFGSFGRQVSGYSLEHLLPEKNFDVASFFAGTEGTLGVMLGATVNLVRDAAIRHLIVLSYPTMADAADDVPQLLPFHPVACEGLGGRIVDIYRRAKGPGSIPELPVGEGFLYVELAGEDAAELASQANRVVAASQAVGHRHVTSVAEQTVLWRIREEGAGLAARSFERPALSGWEDSAVPPAQLGAYLRDFEELLAQHGVQAVPFGHFGDGCVHARIDFPLDEAGGHTVFRNFLTDAAQLVASHGGSLSGEHGDGRARSELLPAMYSAQAIDLFGQVKGVFDPDNLLNPGVLVRPAAVDADLRGSGRKAVNDRLALRLVHDQGDFGSAVHRCTGVGKCRADNRGSNGVMCPSFQATGNEKDSTRGRARVLQEMVDGRLVTGGWRSPEVHEALDLCLSCKGCLSDCPTGVDMASYKAEVLYQSYKGRVRPRSHYFLGWLPWIAKMSAPFARLVNLLLRTPGIGHLGRWLAGVDQRRSIPAFASQRFRNWVRKRPATRKSSAVDRPRVLLWADSFTEFFTTAQGKAAVDVLEAAGYQVEFAERQACCGLTWISTGQLDHARSLVARAVDVLHPYVAAGVPIVGLEPSCLSVLRSDAVELLDDPRAAEVASGVLTLSELLTRTEGWQAPDLSGSTIVVQPHCHQAAVLGFEADLEVLLRSGATVQRLSGCCGLAGNFGVEKGHYEVSVGVAELQLLPAIREASAQTIFLADGFSCRTQIEDLTDARPLHLAELLAP